MPDTLTRSATDDQLATAVRDHGPALRRFCLALTSGDLSRAEELTQETLIRLWKHPDAITSTAYASLRPWLFTVARRLSIDAERARRVRPQEGDRDVPPELPDPGRNPYDLLLDVEAVRQALLALTPGQRDVLVSLYYRGYSGEQAADALGIPVGTVKSRSHYALKALQRELHAHGFKDR